MMQGLSFTRILKVFVLFSHSLQFLLSSHQFSVGDAEEDEDGEEEEELPADELVEGPLHPAPSPPPAARRLHAPSWTQFTRIDIRDILSRLAEKQKKNILAEKQKNILAWHTGLAPKQHAYSLLLCSHSRHSGSHISCRN